MRTLSTHIKRLGFGLVALFAAANLTACGNIHQETGTYYQAPTSDMTVAVMPFENLTNNHNAGMVAAEIAVSELRGRDAFKDVTYMQDVRIALEKRGIKEGDRVRNTEALTIARSLGVDAVLIGSVAEYGYQYGLREEPSVTYNMRLVRVEDSKVLWTFSAGQVGRGVFSRDSVSLVAFSVISDMIDGLVQLPTFHSTSAPKPQQD